MPRVSRATDYNRWRTFGVVIAFIPARSGSIRIPDKNIRDFKGHPLIAYTIRLAIDSGLFSDVIVTSNDRDILDISEGYGANVIARPDCISGSTSPDQEWIDHALEEVGSQDFAILRPTNPFRTIGMLECGLELFKDYPQASQIRAVELCKQHPHKMWDLSGNGTYQIRPYSKNKNYLEQTNTLPKIYVQNGSFEIRRMFHVEHIIPLITEGYEGFDINDMNDWILADVLVNRGIAQLHQIDSTETILDNSLAI